MEKKEKRTSGQDRQTISAPTAGRLRGEKQQGGPRSREQHGHRVQLGTGRTHWDCSWRSRALQLIGGIGLIDRRKRRHAGTGVGKEQGIKGLGRVWGGQEHSGTALFLQEMGRAGTRNLADCSEGQRRGPCLMFQIQAASA